MALKRPTYTQPSQQSRLFQSPEAVTSRKVAGVARKALGVNLAGAAPGADLGGSSKYSREALEDRCGEGFRVNIR
jgi:molybdopterin biosynthesis enzyme MoaB